MPRNPHQLALLEEGVSEPIPSTRYQGSKAKLVNWIWEHTKGLRFDSVLDLFGGTGVVGYMYKRKGKVVYYNDYLQSNSLVGQALIENNTVRLTNGDSDHLLVRDASYNYRHFIVDTFRDVYYADAENEWLDVMVQNIQRLDDPYKRALAFYALFQACLVKRPFNLFHRKNLYLRFAEVPRTFGNKATWDKPFAEHFRNFVFEVNGLVFDNGRPNRALHTDAFEVSGDFDLVYIDPPYTNAAGVSVDYFHFYHFLEGLCRYHEWAQLVDYRFKHRPLKHRHTPWNEPRLIRQAFRAIFEKFKHSTLVVSYRNDGIPSIPELVGYLETLGKSVAVETFAYKYVLSNNHSAEVLLVAT